nr:MFS transporter [Nitrospirillum iridis]
MAPLRAPLFRRVWLASLLSNFGQLILGVGAAWEMTRLSTSAGMVALVQSALMLPMMLIAVPAGAIADMFNRRRVALTGLGFAVCASGTLTLLATLGLTSPMILLLFCGLIGAGVAFYVPAWQATLPELVDAARLPAAIALGTISYNIARSIGPAIGGIVVLALGAKAAFGLNMVCYVPLFLAFYFWRRPAIASPLPPERIDRAIISGFRYTVHSHALRLVYGRAFLFGFSSASSAALAPLIARDLLGGDAASFGLLLGASGCGAVVGALLVGRVAARHEIETTVRICALLTTGALVEIGLSRGLALSCLGLFIIGAASILTIALLNVTAQFASPRWVAARALSLFQCALTGGITLGAGIWGAVASRAGVDIALFASAAVMLATPLVGLVFPLVRNAYADLSPAAIRNEPELALELALRSGPLVVEIDYRVSPDRAVDFYAAMLKVEGTRLRNGGFGWSLARDIGNAELWTERYHCPTWGDYLRMRARFTQADLATQREADAFNLPMERSRVRRRLEQPFGSVRPRAPSDVAAGAPPIV